MIKCIRREDVVACNGSWPSQLSALTGCFPQVGGVPLPSKLLLSLCNQKNKSKLGDDISWPECLLAPCLRGCCRRLSECGQWRGSRGAGQRSLHLQLPREIWFIFHLRSPWGRTLLLKPQVSEEDAAGADGPVSSLGNRTLCSLWRYLRVHVCPTYAMLPLRLGSDQLFGIVVSKMGTFRSFLQQPANDGLLCCRSIQHSPLSPMCNPNS